MKLSGNTILITGGATGIGLDLAKQFIAAGNKVIICGRRKEKLAGAKAVLPSLITIQADIGDMEERRRLFQTCISDHPGLNILVNNAGIQREIDFRKGEADYLNGDSEIAINLEGTLHLTSLFVPHLMKQKESAVVNVSSGLGLVPLVIVPVYSATKAALHSFSISLRKQLAGTSVKVFEVLPPIVDTDLDRGARDRRGQKDKGIPVDVIASETIKGLAADKPEIPIGIVKLLRIGSRINPRLFLKIINQKSPIKPL